MHKSDLKTTLSSHHNTADLLEYRQWQCFYISHFLTVVKFCLEPLRGGSTSCRMSIVYVHRYTGAVNSQSCDRRVMHTNTYRYRPRALVNIYIKYQNGGKVWSLWLWQVCWRHTGWFEFFFFFLEISRDFFFLSSNRMVRKTKNSLWAMAETQCWERLERITRKVWADRKSAVHTHTLYP